MADVIINNTYPGVQYEGTETGAIYYEDREIAGVMYRTQNAQYNKVSQNWSLQDSSKPAYAMAQQPNGAVSFLTMAAGSSAWTAWNGAGQNDFFNVMDFGATGNGTTDDTAAINSAITACNAAGGGVVYLPSGQYKISQVGTSGAAITLLGGVRLKGPNGCFGILAGATSYGARLEPVAGSYNAISADGVNFCGVEDLTILGGTDSAANNNHWAMFFGAINAGLVVRNVAVLLYNMDNANGILLDGGSSGLFAAGFENVSVAAGNSHIGGIGIQIGLSHEVNACTFTNIEIQAMTTGFYDNTGGGNTVTGLWLQGNTTGLLMSSSQLLTVGGWFESNGTAIHFTGTSETCAVLGVRYIKGTGTTQVKIDTGATRPRVFAQDLFNPVLPTGWPVTISAPSTTATTNYFGSDASVFITAGASSPVTVIALGGATTGHTVNASTTSAPIRVPVGQSIKLTWTGTNPPSWAWFGD